jgi:hypothetical protein
MSASCPESSCPQKMNVPKGQNLPVYNINARPACSTPGPKASFQSIIASRCLPSPSHRKVKVIARKFHAAALDMISLIIRVCYEPLQIVVLSEQSLDLKLVGEPQFGCG